MFNKRFLNNKGQRYSKERANNNNFNDYLSDNTMSYFSTSINSFDLHSNHKGKYYSFLTGEKTKVLIS